MYPDEWNGPLAFGLDSEVLDAFGYDPVRIRKYADTWKLYTDHGEFALRFVKVPRAAIERAFQVAEYFATGKIQFGSPRFLRSRYNDAYLRDGDQFYYLTAWPAGVPVDVSQPSHLEGVVQALAGWQTALQGALPQVETVVEAEADPLAVAGTAAFHWYRDAGLGLQAIAASLPSEEDTGHEQEVRKQVEQVVMQIAAVDADLNAMEWWEADQHAAAVGWLCHGDIRPQNLRYTGEGYSILNYEHMYRGHPQLDLVRFLAVVMPIHHWEPRLLRRLVLRYQEGLHESAPFNPRAVATLLQLPFEVLDITARFRRDMAADEGLMDDFRDALEHVIHHAGEKSGAIKQAFAEYFVVEVDKPLQGAIDSSAEDVVHAQLDPEQGNEPLHVEVVAALHKPRRTVRIRRYRPKQSTHEEPGTPGLHLFQNVRDD